MARDYYLCIINLSSTNNQQQNNNSLVVVQEGFLKTIVEFEFQAEHLLHVVDNLLHPATVAHHHGLRLGVVQEERQHPEESVKSDQKYFYLRYVILLLPLLRNLLGGDVRDADGEGSVVVTVRLPEVGLLGLAHQARHRLLLLRPLVDQGSLGGVCQSLVVFCVSLQYV